MKDKLRELVNRISEQEVSASGTCAVSKEQLAELLTILDAEGDGVAVGEALAWSRPIYDEGDIVDIQFHCRPEKPVGDGWRPLMLADGDGSKVGGNGPIQTIADKLEAAITHPARSGMAEAFTDKGMQKLAEHIAASTSPSDESRLEIAYAIARHLKLEGWPAAYQAARSGVVSEEDVRDAARYRWLRDNVQPFRNGNPSPHAIVKVSLGIGADQRERSFDLIDKEAHVGVVTLDQAIDGAIQGERHER